MKVVITGGLGFLGLGIARKLARAGNPGDESLDRVIEDYMEDFGVG